MRPLSWSYELPLRIRYRDSFWSTWHLLNSMRSYNRRAWKDRAAWKFWINDFQTICVPDCDSITLQTYHEANGGEANSTLQVFKEAHQCFQCHHQCAFHCAGKDNTDCLSPRGEGNPCNNVKVNPTINLNLPLNTHLSMIIRMMAKRIVWIHAQQEHGYWMVSACLVSRGVQHVTPIPLHLLLTKRVDSEICFEHAKYWAMIHGPWTREFV